MKIIFAGTPQFAAQALAALIDNPEHQIIAVFTQPDRPAGRGMNLTASPVKQLALQYDLAVHQPKTLKDEAVQELVANMNADLMIVAAYGLILPKAVLSLPQLGCLNIHASILPRWRGAAPIQRAIQAGDKETGITIMQMDEGLDTGDMLLIERCAITTEDTTASLHDKLASLGAKSICDALAQLEQLSAVKQDDTLATYAKKLVKSEARIDWSKPASQLALEIRAFNPFPVCFTQFEQTTLKIWQAHVVDNPPAPAGSILNADKNGILVACGENALCLTLLQRPGSKPQPAQQILQALPIITGSQFTNE